MTTDHIIEAMRVTAHEYEGKPEAQIFVQMLRGIVARAQRYELRRDVDFTIPKIPSNGALAAASQILRHWSMITDGEGREYVLRIARIIDHHLET